VWVLSGGLRVSVVGAVCGGFARGVRPFRPGSFFFLPYYYERVRQARARARTQSHPIARARVARHFLRNGLRKNVLAQQYSEARP
jgi:hypothetical protein